MRLHTGPYLISCMHGCIQLNDDQYSANDINVERAWLQGLTGNGVLVGIVDDGESLTWIKLM